MRDEFKSTVRDRAAKRARYLCSNPDCRASTIGPHSDGVRASGLGVAAHITAASPQGPRYDPELSPEERTSVDNAIWLCPTCATKVDVDEALFPVPLLRQWKLRAELEALHELGKPATAPAMLAEAPVVVSIGQSGGKLADQVARTIVNNTPPAAIR